MGLSHPPQAGETTPFFLSYCHLLVQVNVLDSIE
jgi:hypothetical protein